MFGPKKAKTLEVAVEYYAPHWIVVIRNPGQAHWAALRSKTKMISTQDEFGMEISKRPAIESFPTMQAALDRVKADMGDIKPIERDASDVRDFHAKLYGEKMGQLADRVDPHASRPYARAGARS